VFKGAVVVAALDYMVSVQGVYHILVGVVCDSRGVSEGDRWLFRLSPRSLYGLTQTGTWPSISYSFSELTSVGLSFLRCTGPCWLSGICGAGC